MALFDVSCILIEKHIKHDQEVSNKYKLSNNLKVRRHFVGTTFSSHLIFLFIYLIVFNVLIFFQIKMLPSSSQKHLRTVAF